MYYLELHQPILPDNNRLMLHLTCMDYIGQLENTIQHLQAHYQKTIQNRGTQKLDLNLRDQGFS
jgi:hypothetical protein